MAKNAESLSAQLRAQGSLPAAGPQRVALRYDVARTGQDKGPSQVDRWVRSISGVGNHDPAIGSRNHVDRGVSRSRRGNELEIGKALNDVPRQRGPLTHDA